MKKILFSLMAIAVALVSCKKEEQIVPEIKADKTEYQIPLAGTEEAEFFVEFTTNVDWTAKLKETYDWCTIVGSKGTAGEGKVKVIAEENKTNDERVAVVVVTAGVAQQEFKLIQAQVNKIALVSESAEIDSKGGEVELKVMTNIPYEVTIPEDVTWVKKAATKAYGEQVTKLTVDAYSEFEPRAAKILVSAEGFEPLTFTVNQTGRATVSWVKKPATDWTGFVPANGARLAVYGDYVLLANGSQILALNPADGTVAQTITLPEGMKAQSLCVDDAGNVIFAANAKWANDETAEMLRLYTTKSLEQTPKLLVEYNSGNIWCGEMGNVRVSGNIEGNAVITAYASYSAFWMAWEVTNGVVGALKYGTTPYTSNAFCGCVAPNGATLADGLWFIGYGGDYNLQYCSDLANNTWSVAYVTGCGWMENNDCISVVKNGEKKYLAMIHSCHFNYDSPEVVVLDATQADKVEKFYTLNIYSQANWVEDGVDEDGNPKYINKDWTGAGTFSDACITEKDGVLYVYYIDAQYGVAGCLKIE